ncbi:preprotein translocase subunit SecA [Candidatus Marinamargulisbacteria bacterium SCGC AG-410-N11]|nr:preprotein translocase subunit SecA [Candidatus Marinamargulisbacteria bacterium SCGC AG-410-N11]
MKLIKNLLMKVLGDPNEKILGEFQSTVNKINELESTIQSKSDQELCESTSLFKQRLANGESLDDMLPEAFATVREASVRTLQMRHFDVQLIGGIVLHRGMIAEMKTGEGKTLMSVLAAYLNALEGKGVYIVTVNDYLARRDCEWMGKIYNFLGMSAGVIQSQMSTEDKINAYKSDITYGTNNEFGFDYLRDNLTTDVNRVCQIRRHFAIIDEVDSILIDEARTPLIISGASNESTKKYVKLSKLIKNLDKDTHFTLDEKHKNITLTDLGIETIEKQLGLSSLFSVENMDAAHMVVQCLKAKYLFAKDVDYVVKDGKVVIVDEFTGRLMDGRRYSDGLHQAIEAKENLKVREESVTMASVTFQNYFRLFPKLSGMTGTAITEAEEFLNIYHLPVVSIPTNKPMKRNDVSDVIYKTKEEKYKAIVTYIEQAQSKGQPVLVGTISIDTSELLSRELTKKKIKHNVLNAKHHEKEATIIASAGKKGSVTIATNMAGRGTDIVLGEGVKELGGLAVIGSERHESRRIDNQLRGRSGRQGDPGFSRFYVALDDDLMRLFGSDRIAKVMDTLGLPSDTPIEHNMITKSIEKAQKKVESHHYSVRKHILEYDNVLNKQRETIYEIRNKILLENSVESVVDQLIHDFVSVVLDEFNNIAQSSHKETQESVVKQIIAVFPVNETDLNPMFEPYIGKLNKPQFRTGIIKDIKLFLLDFYNNRKVDFPQDVFVNVITRQIILMNVDRKWVDHLHNMDLLREGIGLRAWGQRDPLIEYKKESFDMFKLLLLDITEESFTVINRAVLVDEKLSMR